MLSDVTLSFVSHCGEMGSQWGFNKTVGQLLGLLMMHPEPLNADDITELLNISRSNVSMALKELQSWRLIQMQHKPGDRKEYFSAKAPIWDMAKTILEERRKRELDPTLALLRYNLAEASQEPGDQYATSRMQEIYDLLELLSRWSANLQTLTPENFKTLMTMGDNMNKLLMLKDKVIGKAKK